MVEDIFSKSFIFLTKKKYFEIKKDDFYLLLFYF